MQMPNINDQILNNGVDEEVIDAQVIDQPAKKKKMVRALSILGVCLIAGGGYMMYTDQKPQQPVNSELQRILAGAENRPPKTVPPATPQPVPTPPQSPEQTISGKPEEPKPAGAATTSTPAAPVQPVPVSASAPAPAAAAAAQTKPPAAAEVKPPAQPAQSEKEILLEKKVAHLIATVEALKTQVAKLSQQRAPATPAVVAAAPKRPIASSTDLPVKAINLKESGILATTVNSLIVFYGGKNQEIFIGDVIPGTGEKLANTNPHAREFTTNRAIYRSVN